MSLAPFAALEARVNNAVLLRLANATAVYQGGDPFPILLDREQTEAFGGGGGVVDAPSITVSFDTANTPGLAEGSELVIGGVVHAVVQGVQADASGWVSGLVVFVKRG